MGRVEQGFFLTVRNAHCEDDQRKTTGHVKRQPFTREESMQMFPSEINFLPESAEVFRKSTICTSKEIQRDIVYLKKVYCETRKDCFQLKSAIAAFIKAMEGGNSRLNTAVKQNPWFKRWASKKIFP